MLLLLFLCRTLLLTASCSCHSSDACTAAAAATAAAASAGWSFRTLGNCVDRTTGAWNCCPYLHWTCLGPKPGTRWYIRVEFIAPCMTAERGSACRMTAVCNCHSAACGTSTGCLVRPSDVRLRPRAAAVCIACCRHARCPGSSHPELGLQLSSCCCVLVQDCGNAAPRPFVEIDCAVPAGHAPTQPLHSEPNGNTHMLQSVASSSGSEELLLLHEQGWPKQPPDKGTSWAC